MNTKKLLITAVATMTFPLVSLAAFDDVTLETTAILDVGGYELTVSGSSAVIESIEVGAATFTVDLQNGSSITVASADRVDFAYDVAAQTTTETCGVTESTLLLSVASAGATTVVVTPSGVCVEDVAEEEDAGGGGGSSRRRPIATTTDAVAPTPANPQIEALLAQIKTIVEQIIALGGNVSPDILALLGTPTGSAYSSRDLDIGSDGDDVLALQNFLIAQNKGPKAQALKDWGATGYFGPLTQAALAEFQAAVGIAPAVGYFGPKTRVYINGL